MAYTKDTLLSYDPIAVSGEARLFKYSTNDEGSDVIASGYFDPDTRDSSDAANLINKGSCIFVDGPDYSGYLFVQSLSPIVTKGDIGAAGIVWVDVPSYSSKWESHAEVALAGNGSIAFMKGNFVSNENDNNDPLLTFPEGTTGSFSLLSSMTYTQSTHPYYAHQLTWPSAGTTINFTGAGFSTDDYVVATYHTLPSAGGGPISAKITSATNITFEVGTSIGENDAIINFVVFKSEGEVPVYVGSSAGQNLAGIGPTAQNGWSVQVNLAYDVWTS